MADAEPEGPNRPEMDGSGPLVDLTSRSLLDAAGASLDDWLLKLSRSFGDLPDGRVRLTASLTE